MTPTMLGTIGIWLLVAAVIAIFVELTLMAVWGLAMGRRMQALSQRLASQRAQIEADVEKLRHAIEETKALWQPYGRVLRWLRHPLVLALLGSYRRRMAAR
ncbi:MAG TPA: hypothetical protein VN985_04675 [Candidatus Eisenbacteria bacterium]|nr:hypothetical protein [Candidatus Eisenbacteria bacterium]